MQPVCTTLDDVDLVVEPFDELSIVCGQDQYAENSGLEHKLLEQVKMRASQINGCAYCLDMHRKDARAAE